MEASRVINKKTDITLVIKQITQILSMPQDNPSESNMPDVLIRIELKNYIFMQTF